MTVYVAVRRFETGGQRYFPGDIVGDCPNPARLVQRGLVVPQAGRDTMVDREDYPVRTGPGQIEDGTLPPVGGEHPPSPPDEPANEVARAAAGDVEKADPKAQGETRTTPPKPAETHLADDDPAERKALLKGESPEPEAIAPRADSRTPEQAAAEEKVRAAAAKRAAEKQERAAGGESKK